MDQMHIVDFQRYCETCVYRDVKDTDEPCDECLTVPARENSSRPVNWKERREK